MLQSPPKLLKPTFTSNGLSILRMILHHPVEMRNHESLHHLISELFPFNLNCPVHFFPESLLYPLMKEQLILIQITTQVIQIRLNPHRHPFITHPDLHGSPLSIQKTAHILHDRIQLSLHVHMSRPHRIDQ